MQGGEEAPGAWTGEACRGYTWVQCSVRLREKARTLYVGYNVSQAQGFCLEVAARLFEMKFTFVQPEEAVN